MKRFLFLVIVLILVVVGHAQAETITTTGNLFLQVYSDEQVGTTIDYWSFKVNTDGIVQIDTLSVEDDWVNYFDLNGDGEIAFIDPYIYLFNDDGSLDASDLIASNDDTTFPSGTGDGSVEVLGDVLDSFLEVSLATGDYTLAVGDFYLDLASAVAGGINLDSLGPYTEDWLLNDHGDYQLQFTGEDIEITSDPGTDVLPPIPIAATTTGNIFPVFDDTGNYIGGTIDYWSFTVDEAGIVQIDTLSVEDDGVNYVDLNGDGEIAFIDPYIYLFNDYPGSIDESDFIASNDDTTFTNLGAGDGSVHEYDSFLSVLLEEGNYTLAVSDYDFSLASAVAGGINPDSFGPYTEDTEDWLPNDHGDYQLQFAGNITITGTPSEPIPEPASMLLLSPGIIGLARLRRKFRKRRQ